MTLLRKVIWVVVFVIYGFVLFAASYYGNSAFLLPVIVVPAIFSGIFWLIENAKKIRSEDWELLKNAIKAGIIPASQFLTGRDTCFLMCLKPLVSIMELVFVCYKTDCISILLTELSKA